MNEIPECSWPLIVLSAFIEGVCSISKTIDIDNLFGGSRRYKENNEVVHVIVN